MVLAAHNNVSREHVQRFFAASMHSATVTAPRASAILASPSTGPRTDNSSTFASDVMPVPAMRSQELASQFFAILNIFFGRRLFVFRSDLIPVKLRFGIFLKSRSWYKWIILVNPDKSWRFLGNSSKG